MGLADYEANLMPNQSCPCCGSNTMSTKQAEYNVEHFGVVLMSTTTCQECGYKHSDVISLEKREPLLVKAKISTVADLNIKVIKSATATITIPEFGATITPGTDGEGFVTNVEGVLRKVEDTLNFMLRSADEKRLRKGQRILKRLQLSRKSKPCFTIIIEDPLGNSGLVSANQSKVRKRRLTDAELRKVKFGQYALDSTGAGRVN